MPRDNAEGCATSVSEPSTINHRRACAGHHGDHCDVGGAVRQQHHLPTAGEKLPQLVDTRAAANILRKSASTLKRWRYEGIGPDYVEIEGRISYDVRALLEHIQQHTRVPSVRAQMEASRGL